MNSLLLTTKLSIPAPCAGLVSRPRLTSRLEQDCRLALIVAPAGWGKSSVVSEWCAQTAEGSRSVAWVSLDAGDNDPTRFLLYVAAACDTAHPGLGETTRRLLQSSQPPPPETALTVLLNEISALGRALVCVLDDYHLIEALPIHHAMTFLLDHQPPNLRIITTTRTDPPLPLSRLRVRGQLSELRASDLRFTHDEAVAFLNQVMGLNLQPEAVARLEARTEGWIAGLQLAALSLQGRANPAEFLDSFTGSNRYIVDYLFDEVLSRQTEAVQTFLQETSLLSRLCGPLCEAVTGQAGGQALLAKLEAGNLFLIPLDDERRWYRYHHLFADVLQARLAQQGGERVSELHGRAATWYDSQRIGEEAVHHALAGNHLELAVQYIERYSEEMWKRGEQRTIERWLRALPEERILSRPEFCVWQGCVYLFNLQADALGRLLDACRPEVLSEDPLERDVQGRLLALDGFLARMQGKYAYALEVSQKAYTCFTEDNSVWRGLTLFGLGPLYFEAGDLRATIEAFREAGRLARAGEDLITALVSPGALGQAQEESGALREAARTYRSALNNAAERKVGHFPHLCWLYAGLGRLHYQWNELPAALAFLQEGLKCNVPNSLNPCSLELLKVKKALGDAEGITALCEQMKASPIPHSVFDLQHVVAAFHIWTQPEQKEEREAWVERYEARTEEPLPLSFPYLPYRETEMLVWARVRSAQGADESVKAQLESLLETLIRQERHGAAVAVRTLLAPLYQQEGRMDRAVAVLEPALILAAKEGYVRVFLDAGRPLLPVMRQAVAQGIEPEFLTRLLDVFRSEGLLQAEAKPQDASALAVPLSEREVEVLRLVAAGLSNPQIAEHLFLSVGTVKRHVYNIYIKLEVTGRVEAVTRARELDLL